MMVQGQCKPNAIEFTGQPDFDYATISDEMGERIRQKMVNAKLGTLIAEGNELNEKIEAIIKELGE